MSRLEAHHILQRLGEGGQPPEHGVERINVGNESALRVLEHEYFKNLLKSGASFKLVQGYYGGGKTHFLYCVREIAWRHGFATAVVELSPGECPYDDSLKVYRAVARRIASRPAALGATPDYGIGDLVRAAVDDKMERARATLAERGSDDSEGAARVEVRDWLDSTVRRTPCESHSFRQAIVELGLAWLSADRSAEARLGAWLAGEPVPIKELRDSGVYETMSRTNGFTMLRCLVQMVVGLGLGGTALLFDEVDRNLSVSQKRTHEIGDNLRQVIDLCGRHQLPRTLFVYAVPPEFMRNVVPDYPALHQRLRAPLPLSVRSPQAVLIDLERLDLEPVDLLSALGEKVVTVFEEAREVELDHQLQRDNARTLARACAESFFDVNHRRLFAKTWVEFLHHQFADGSVKLDDIQAKKLVDGTFSALDVPTDDGFSDL